MDEDRVDLCPGCRPRLAGVDLHCGDAIEIHSGRGWELAQVEWSPSSGWYLVTGSGTRPLCDGDRARWA